MDDEITMGSSPGLSELRKNTCICADCGKPFEQGFRINQKTGDKIFNKYNAILIRAHLTE